MRKTTIDFRTSISDVKQMDPSFSTCKVRVLYTGRNRNMSIIEKKAVEQALPTLLNKPIIGEYSKENEDWKGHGGAIDMDTYDFIHTTKPYGLVPESATFEWETIGGREYLTVHGCLLWTGRYPEAYSVIEKAKGQSMEIEVMSGEWVEADEAYRIDAFTFSALCILGDNVAPAFEDASISAYSLKSETFQLEFQEMMSAVKESQNKEGTKMEKLKELLAKYSTTVEVLTAKGLVFEDISEDDLEDKIMEALEITPEPENGTGDPTDPTDGANADPEGLENPEDLPKGDNPEDLPNPEGANAPSGTEGAGTISEEDVQALNDRIAKLEGELVTKDEELDTLREFKLNIEKKEHADKVQALFSNFQMSEDDVKDINIDEMSIEEIEEKCYSIIGRKLAKNKNFSHNKEKGGIHLPLSNENNQDGDDLPYGGLVEKYKNKE